MKHRLERRYGLGRPHFITCSCFRGELGAASLGSSAKGAIVFVRNPKNGAPGGIRTPDPLLRRQTLFPTELRAHSSELIQFTALVASPQPTTNAAIHPLHIAR